jgi:hypothetical protein
VATDDALLIHEFSHQRPGFDLSALGHPTVPSCRGGPQHERRTRVMVILQFPRFFDRAGLESCTPSLRSPTAAPLLFIGGPEPLGRTRVHGSLSWESGERQGHCRSASGMLPLRGASVAEIRRNSPEVADTPVYPPTRRSGGVETR